MATIGTDIQIAADFIMKNQLVGMPTETVYGLAGLATSEKAISSIFEVKNRPSFDPLIMHVASFEQSKEWVRDLPFWAIDLAKIFCPGPLTLLLNKTDRVSDLITAGLPRVAIRVPKHILALDFLQKVNLPVCAPSANPFGYVSPTCAQHVKDQLGSKIPYIIDGGPCVVGLESTIIGEENGQITIYRKGGLEIEQIEKVVGPVFIKDKSTSNPAAPGMLLKHYSPKVPLIAVDEYPLQLPHNEALIGFGPMPDTYDRRQILNLSPTGDLHEAAKNLFSFLRKIDNLNFEKVWIKWLPEISLGRAMNDRIRRAVQP